MINPIIGIIGGGQLGSLLAKAAKKIDIKSVIFCDDINSLASLAALVKLDIAVAFLSILFTVLPNISVIPINFFFGLLKTFFWSINFFFWV